jgi:hypothetical protein
MVAESRKKRGEGEPCREARYILTESLIWRVKRRASDLRLRPAHLVQEVLERYLSEQETAVPA